MKFIVLGSLVGLILASPAGADTISAKQIAAGIADSKTEIAQEAWWKANMAGRRHEITGKVKDVEEGTFSGYWVRMTLNRSIDMQCGLGDEWRGIAAQLTKGQMFTCKGDVASTWTSVFGILFSMDYTGPQPGS